MKNAIIFISIILFTVEIHAQQNSSTIKEDENYLPDLAENIGDIKLSLDTIVENYYVISGEGVAGNISLYTGADGIYLVDDQWSALLPRIKEMISSISDKPVKLVINTHYHIDHTNGNTAFRKAGIPVIAQANARLRMTQRQVIRGFGSVVQKPAPMEALPNLTFTDKIEIHDGNEIIELKNYPDAHTDGDVIVHFKRADIYCMGDVFVTFGIPVIDPDGGGDIYGLIEAIDFLISDSRKTSRIIPGHGPISSREDLIAYRDLLESILVNVIKSYRQGKSMEQTIDYTKGQIEENVEGIDKDLFITLVYEMVEKHEKQD